MKHLYQEQLPKQFLDSVPITMRTLRSLMRQAAQDNLSVPQFRSLLCIQRGMGHVGEVAEHLGVSQPAASKLVDFLVKKKLVKREKSTQDKRQSQLTLTPSGKKLHARVRSMVEQALQQKLMALSQQEQALLFNALILMEGLFQ